MAKRKARKQERLREEVNNLEKLLINNSKAVEEGPRKKNWSMHDIKNIKPLTDTQEDLFHAFYNGQNVVARGSAGTGKTFLALYLALSEVLRHDAEQDKVIIVRSAVATRDMGFMPGDLDEKIAFYETPYRDICASLFGRPSTYDDMKKAGKIQFMPTSFIRGLTWDNAVIIVDEGQNMTFHEINSIMTRVGDHSRMIFTGDLPQTDLRKTKTDTSGMSEFLKVARAMKEFELVQFTKHDIVRSRFVKNWIIACESENVNA